MLDAIDRRLVNSLQHGLPVGERPYAEAARRLGIEEDELIRRLGRLLDSGTLSRFGPMYNAERLGGAFCLCAVAAPPERLESAVAAINAHPEVAHNYERSHRLNVWFVLATGTPEDVATAIARIEAEIGLEVLAFPKLEEFYVGLEVSV